MRLTGTLLAVVLAFAPGVHAQPGLKLTQRLHAEGVKFDDAGNLQWKIWADHVADWRATALPYFPGEEFFTATLQDEARRIVISVVHEGCTTTSGLDDDLFCPARFVELEDGRMTLLKQVDDFDIHMIRGNEGYDETSNSNRSDYTSVTFDPSRNEVIATTVRAGKSGSVQLYALR